MLPHLGDRSVTTAFTTWPRIRLQQRRQHGRARSTPQGSPTQAAASARVASEFSVVDLAAVCRQAHQAQQPAVSPGDGSDSVQAPAPGGCMAACHAAPPTALVYARQALRTIQCAPPGWACTRQEPAGASPPPSNSPPPCPQSTLGKPNVGGSGSHPSGSSRKGRRREALDTASGSFRPGTCVGGRGRGQQRWSRCAREACCRRQQCASQAGRRQAKRASQQSSEPASQPEPAAAGRQAGATHRLIILRVEGLKPSVMLMRRERVRAVCMIVRTREASTCGGAGSRGQGAAWARWHGDGSGQQRACVRHASACASGDQGSPCDYEAFDHGLGRQVLCTLRT